MKVRLDENVSWRVARTLQAFLSDTSGLEVSYVRDVHPPGTSDPTWITGFANAGGHAVVSGDANILQHWVDLVAYTESGLIAYFPSPAWSRMKAAGRAAFIMRWWPTLVEHIKIAERGTSWRMPMVWTPSITGLEQLRDPRIQTRAQQHARGIRPLATISQFRPESESE